MSISGSLAKQSTEGTIGRTNRSGSSASVRRQLQRKRPQFVPMVGFYRGGTSPSMAKSRRFSAGALFLGATRRQATGPAPLVWRVPLALQRDHPGHDERAQD